MTVETPSGLVVRITPILSYYRDTIALTASCGWHGPTAPTQEDKDCVVHVMRFLGELILGSEGCGLKAFTVEHSASLSEAASKAVCEFHAYGGKVGNA